MKSDCQRDKKRTIACVVCGTKFHPFRASRGKCCSQKCGARLVGIERAEKVRSVLVPPPPVRGARWVPLNTGRFVLVDAKDYARVVAFPWSDDGRSGAHVFPGRKRVRLHRFILGLPGTVIVDHKDGNTADCRRKNLRPASTTESIRNRRKQHRDGPPASKYKGVTLKKDQPRSKPWMAGIRIGDRRLTLGYFKSDAEAAKVYDLAAREHFGAFAALNFPRRGERSALDA